MEENIKRDKTIDLTSLIREKKEDTSTLPTEAPTANSGIPKMEPAKEELSPAQKLIRDRQTGLVVENEELAKGSEKPLRSHVDSDDRLENYQETLNNMDDLIVKQSYLVMKNKPTSESESKIWAAMMVDELNSMSLDELKALSEKNPDGAKLKSRFFDLAPKAAREIKSAPDAEYVKASGGAESTPKPKEPAVPEDPNSVSALDLDNAPTSLSTNQSESIQIATEEEDTDGFDGPERENLVKVLIDKTNLGLPPIFDEVERDKILMAEQLDIVEVERVELESIRVKKPTKSLLETLEGFDTYGVNIAMTFPCSRFRATMGGLTYGEMTDVAMAYQDVTYDRMLKKLSIIYNKMRNVSCGAFDSFDDFLDNFSYMDITLGTYALYIASSPEKDTIGLKCGNKSCGRDFRWDFRPRSLLQMDLCSDTFLNAMKEVVDASGVNAIELFKKAPHKNEKIFKLPNSGWLIHVAYATCREYLDQILKNNDIEEFRKTHPEDVNGTTQSGILFLQMIRAISIPTADGEYERYDDVIDVLEAIYNMNIDDLRIMSEIVDHYSADYAVEFGVKDVVCPHCGAKTALVPVDIDELVFRAYQRRLSTTVNLASLGDL